MTDSSSRWPQTILLIGGAILFTAAGGCATRPQPLPDTVRRPLASESDVRVRLHFGEEADLDLHVTGADLETVYFGNNPSKSGGWLEEDLRCNATAPRVEVITIPNAEKGRYRVGVDFIKSCVAVSGPVPYEIEVDALGFHLEERGEVAAGRFHSVALEFDVE